MRRFVLFVLVLFLSGCAQTQWVKPDGATLTQQDQQACHEQAIHKAGGQMNSDPFLYREDMESCLQSKGYTLKKG